MTDDPGIPTDPAPDPEEPGRVISGFTGRITLRDPRNWDVSRANRPIEPPDMTVIEAEETIREAFEAKGYAVGIELTKTTNSR